MVSFSKMAAPIGTLQPIKIISYKNGVACPYKYFCGKKHSKISIFAPCKLKRFCWLLCNIFILFKKKGPSERSVVVPIPSPTRYSQHVFFNVPLKSLQSLFIVTRPAWRRLECQLEGPSRGNRWLPDTQNYLWSCHRCHGISSGIYSVAGYCCVVEAITFKIFSGAELNRSK